MPQIYDLEERTLEFGLNIVRLCKKVSRELVNQKIVDQLVRSGTSVGANYREANEAGSKRDFKNRIKIAKKEAKESLYWLDLLIEASPDLRNEIVSIRSECVQLVKILGAIFDRTIVD